MKILNYQYKSQASLKEFIEENNIENLNKTFIQIFYSKIDDTSEIIDLKNFLNQLLPNSSIMGTSTAGIINNNTIDENCIQISFSIFEKSTTKTKSYNTTDVIEIISDIKKNILQNNTKLLVVFANTFKINSNEIINLLNNELPNIVVCGGNSGDDFNFKSGLVFTNKSDDATIAITSINSDYLNVNTNYLLNWQTIGKNMTITKSYENIIYEINNQSAVSIYEQYLGKDVSNNLPESGIEFPLIFVENDINIARAPIALGDDGSLVMAGYIEEGTKVKFGFANIAYIEENNLKSIQEKEHKTSEGMYIYSCSVRKKILGEFLNDELALLNSICPTSGFITYGEFYCDLESSKKSSLLNITTTYVTLSENKQEKFELKDTNTHTKSKHSMTLKALTHLTDKTTKDLEDSMYYLKQFKDAMFSSLIFSSADKKGNITHINKNFEKISGYTKEELLGKPHNIVRSPNMKKEFFKDMWSKLKRFEEWKGVVQNLNKNGKFYYVLSHVFPILNSDGSLKEYISIRHDITDTERRRESLEGKVEELNDLTLDKEALLSQYATAIDNFGSTYRFNLEFNITYENEVFKDTFCNLKNTNIKNILDKEFYKNNFKEIEQTISSKNKYKGIIKYFFKDKTILIDSTITPILDKNNNILEYMVMGYEITEVITAKQEIIDTQKDIIFTMGEIGETRSKETGNHVKRVAEYSKILALLWGMNEKDADILKMASPMHDIGKVGIPDNILNKPGKLTADEWEIMQTHSMLGYNMLKGSNKTILKTASIVAKYHHEKFDGSGYPEGLKANEIPIEARITAIADVFDALGSDRVYKKSWELEKIYELLQNEKGKHFDPELIELFFDNLDSFLKIRAEYKDHV